MYKKTNKVDFNIEQKKKITKDNSNRYHGLENDEEEEETTYVNVISVQGAQKRVEEMLYDVDIITDTVLDELI